MNIIDIARTIANLEIELITTITAKSDNERLNKGIRDTERCISEAATHMKTMLKELQDQDQDDQRQEEN